MLEQFLVTQSFAFLLIFARIGAGVMVLPGIGEAYVPPRIRLLFALMISLVLLPLLSTSLPAAPASPYMLGILLAGESLVGLFIGGVVRILISVMHVAGTVIAYQIGLSSATVFDINQTSQGAMIGNLLSLTGVILLFVLDLHHLMLQGLADSYAMFPAGSFPDVADMSDLAATTVSRSFLVAMKLSAPFLIVGIITNLAAGVLARLMPNMQIFFVMMPPQIVLGLFLLMATLSAIMLGFAGFVDDTMNYFVKAS